MRGLNTEIHSVVIELLQCIISRGDLDQLTIGTLEAAVTIKLFWLVHSERLELQNKLLHLLHSIISSSAGPERHRMKSPALTLQTSVESEAAVDDGHIQPLAASASINSLFVQLLVDGISTSSNRPLLHHWLDFVLLTVPQFPNILNPAIMPLNVCACRQLRRAVNDLSTVLSMSRESPKESQTTVDDAELVMLLNAMERLILLCLDELDSTDELSTTDKTAAETPGLFSMVSNVFMTDAPNTTAESNMTVRYKLLSCYARL